MMNYFLAFAITTLGIQASFCQSHESLYTDTGRVFDRIHSIMGKDPAKALGVADSVLRHYDLSIFWMQKSMILYDRREFGESLRTIKRAESLFLREKLNKKWNLDFRRDDYVNDTIKLRMKDDPSYATEIDSILMEKVITPWFENRQYVSLSWAVDSKLLTFEYRPLQLLQLRAFCKFNLEDYYGCYDVGLENFYDAAPIDKGMANKVISYISLAGAYSDDYEIQKSLIDKIQDLINEQDLDDDTRGRLYYALGLSYKGTSEFQNKREACTNFSSAYEYGIDCLDLIKSYCR
jgi:hypothetical protein